MTTTSMRFAPARCVRALGIISFVLAMPTVVLAARGDCAQPSTNGAAPTATDCLYILKAAVGSVTCSPACICAPKGSLPTTATDALVCLRKAVGQATTLDCPCASPVTEGDNFDDNSKDPEKWGTDEIYGNGVLKETNKRLEYTCKSGTDKDDDILPWILSRLPYDAPWEMQLDVVNQTTASITDQVNSFGIKVRSAFSEGDEIYAELYMYKGPYPAIYGFHTDLETNDQNVAMADTGDLGAHDAAVRMTFDSAKKVVTVFYDADRTNGYQWVPYGTFGLAGSGGADGNTDWGMTDSDTFPVYVYGYSEGMSVAAGKMYGDNFSLTGGVAP